MRTMRLKQMGYLLPATILLGLGISIMSGTFLKYTAISSETLNNQSYNSIAQEAARAGIEYAHSCYSLGQDNWTNANPLRPNTTCAGTGNNGSPYVTVHGTEWRSTFEVAQKDAQDNVVATGNVEINSNGAWIKVAETTNKMSLGNQYEEFPTSSGETITDIKSDETTCAIANGKLYCWGDNSHGQVGDGTTTNRSNPTLVKGALEGKTVTRVSVSDEAVCAIADGTPYCWGNNWYYQLGSDNHTDYRIPTANVPVTNAAPFSGKIVTDIGTSSWNWPFTLWPFSKADPHSCGLTAEGAVACWGDNGYRQLTGGGMAEICVIICIPTGYYDFPDKKAPTLIKGYRDDTGPFAGKKAERVGASSHDSCLLAQGRMYCMGVPAPLPVICYVPPTGQFSSAGIFGLEPDLGGTLIPFNPCIATFSNGYDVSALSWPLGGFTMNNKFIDPSTWEVSTNEGCMMANSDFACFGTTPAYSISFLDAWGPPWLNGSLGGADITNHDNGDHAGSTGLAGTYCVVDRGVGKCAGSLLNPGTGTGQLGVYKLFRPILTGDPDDPNKIGSRVVTKIAAQGFGGCAVANGQLFCWGTGSPQLAGRGGATPIGTDNAPASQYPGNQPLAATGQVSVGGSHTCGVANGKLFCWGEGSSGQLGMDNTNSLGQPTAVPSLSASHKSITDVSAGANHTCAIAAGDLFCWGKNDKGQLGLGDTTNRLVPVEVGGVLAGKRVTKVSAGYDSTCAIANGQAYCWGNNASRQLGDGTTTNRTVPTAVSAYASSNTANQLTGKSVTSISIGVDHACAVANADLFCWGNNANGRTGLNTTNSTPSAPTKVTTFRTASNSNVPNGPNNMTPAVSAVSVGSNFSCAIVNGTVSCFGSNANGRTGLGTTSGDQLVPRQISGTPGTYYATTISAGTHHVCAVLNGGNSAANGNLFCWGHGANGRLGHNATSDSSTAVRINGGDTIDSSVNPATEPHRVRRVGVNISAGDASTCAVANGVILCWGAGGSGRLGTGGALTDRTEPVRTSKYRFVRSYERGPIF